jgi:hypothetical protein
LALSTSVALISPSENAAQCLGQEAVFFVDHEAINDLMLFMNKTVRRQNVEKKERIWSSSFVCFYVRRIFPWDGSKVEKQSRSHTSGPPGYSHIHKALAILRPLLSGRHL